VDISLRKLRRLREDNIDMGSGIFKLRRLDWMHLAHKGHQKATLMNT
jgi:hypothetical protein